MAEVVAVACVVDSSLALYAEWHRIMAEYIVPLLQRLYDAGRQVRLSFPPSAALSDTPLFHVAPYRLCMLRLICNSAEPPTVQAWLRSSPEHSQGTQGRALQTRGRSDRRRWWQRHGCTGGSGRRYGGVSIPARTVNPSPTHSPLWPQLIDILKSSPELSQKSVCHIIHVAASPPDAAERPLWNASPRFDSVTWGSLPSEVQKACRPSLDLTVS